MQCDAATQTTATCCQHNCYMCHRAASGGSRLSAAIDLTVQNTHNVYLAPGPAGPQHVQPRTVCEHSKHQVVRIGQVAPLHRKCHSCAVR